jgi:RHS repeat-associated protein
VQNGTQIGNPYTFTGRRLDYTTGLYYYRARTYSPDLGRFLQRDPLGYVDGLNLFAYAGNNPAVVTDPWGLTWGLGLSASGTAFGWGGTAGAGIYVGKDGVHGYVNYGGGAQSFLPVTGPWAFWSASGMVDYSHSSAPKAKDLQGWSPTLGGSGGDGLAGGYERVFSNGSAVDVWSGGYGYGVEVHGYKVYTKVW